MMKETTLKRINTLVINYLSIVGLWGEKHLEQNNPVVMYFMTNILLNRPPIDPSKNEPIIIEDSLENAGEFLTMDIPPSFFHVLVKELYNVYEKLDDINKHQNPEIREMLTHFVGNEHNFNMYVESIMQQYKDSFYELATHYNSYNPEYNNIRISVLNDKMNEYIQIEDYMEAAKIRDKINDIKEKGK